MRNFVFLLFLFNHIGFCYGQTSHYAPSENVEIHYRLIGVGEPLLIINGGPGFNSDGFLPMATELSKLGYQSILFDQRGTGSSFVKEMDSTTISMDLMVKDMEAIRIHMKIEEWNILGHSFGGMMANYYITKHPERVKSLIASSSGGVDLSLLQTARASILSKLSSEQIDSLNYWTSQTQIENNPEMARIKRAEFLAPAYVFDKRNTPIVAKRLTQGDMELNSLVWQDLLRIDYDCKNQLKSFDKPVLIIQGMNDIVSEHLAYTTDSTFINSEVVFLDSCGHYGWLDQPEKYYSTISNFLNKVH